MYLSGGAEEGRKLVEIAMRLNPNSPQKDQLCQGRVLYVLRSYDEAVSAFKQALERYPESERIPLWLAATHAQIGEVERAGWEIEQVYALEPGFYPLFLEQGTAFRFQTDLGNFLDSVRKAMRVDKSFLTNGR